MQRSTLDRLSNRCRVSAIIVFVVFTYSVVLFVGFLFFLNSVLSTALGVHHSDVYL